MLQEARQHAGLLDGEPLSEAVEGVGEGFARTDLERDHVEVLGERRIALDELAGDALNGGLHRQSGLRAHHHQVHEIGEAHAVLVDALLDAAPQVEGRGEIAEDRRRGRREPQMARRQIRLEHGRHEGGDSAEQEREPEPGREEDPDGAPIEEAGLDELRADALRLARIAARKGGLQIGDEAKQRAVPRRAARPPSAAAPSEVRRLMSLRPCDERQAAHGQKAEARRDQHDHEAGTASRRVDESVAHDQILKLTMRRMTMLPTNIQDRAPPST